MRIRYLLVPAMLVAGVAGSLADEAAEKPVAAVADEATVDKSAGVEVKAGKAAAERPSPRRLQRGEGPRGDPVLYHTMLFQILDEPEAREKIGLDPDVYQELVTIFKTIDKQVSAKRADLGYLQATQAKLIVDGAAEPDVMAAVDAVWKARADIAKFQTAKLLKVRALLTEEQVKKLDEVRREIHRARRKDQLREGEADRPAREGRTERRPRREKPADTSGQ